MYTLHATARCRIYASACAGGASLGPRSWLMADDRDTRLLVSCLNAAATLRDTCVCVYIYLVCACEFARTPPPRRHSNDDVIHYMYYILYSPRQLPFRCRAMPPLPHRFTLYLYQLVPKSDSSFVCCRSLFSRNDIINIIIVTALYIYLYRCWIATGFAQDDM